MRFPSYFDTSTSTLNLIQRSTSTGAREYISKVKILVTANQNLSTQQHTIQRKHNEDEKRKYKLASF